MPSPSPSPPPSAPVQSIVQPGPRATALHKIYTSALTSTLKTNSYANFASCFPTPARYCPTALEGVWRQLNSRLEEECQKDFAKILEERKVVEGLNNWDDLLDQARVRRESDSGHGDESQGEQLMHMLSADDLYAANVHKYLVRATRELEVKLSETQKSNVEVMAEVKAQRAEIDRLMNGLEARIQDVEGAVKVLETGTRQGAGIRKETWDMEQEVHALKQE